MGLSVSGVPFIKMHGLGNDFVVIDMRGDLPGGEGRGLKMTPSLARDICDRHFGVGADQLLLLSEPFDRTAQVRMDIWNADGSRSNMCGNGIRAVALHTRASTIETGAGIKHIKANSDHTFFTVDMGVPTVAPSEVLSLSWGDVTFSAVDIGNPHAVIFVENVDSVPLEQWGPELSSHSRFKERTNVEFVEMLTPLGVRPRARVRVWERGAGATLACGSGACAVAAALQITGRGSCAEGSAEILLPGGKLEIDWKGPGERLLMTGPATRVFEGRL